MKKITIDFSKIKGSRYLRTKRSRTLLLKTIKKHFRNSNLKITPLLNSELWKFGIEGSPKTEVAFIEHEKTIWAHLPTEKPENFLPKPKEKKEAKAKKASKPDEKTKEPKAEDKKQEEAKKEEKKEIEKAAKAIAIKQKRS